MIQLKPVPQSPFTVPDFNAVVVGEGAIGAALVDELLSYDNLAKLVVLRRSTPRGREDSRVRYLRFDASAIDTPLSLDELELERVHALINTVGVLHSPALQPEKRLRAVEASALIQSFTVNATVVPRLAQTCGPLLRHAEPAVFASLSARVGSIEDNQLGGWYSYRASKAAHNMLLRTLAREWRVSHRNVTVAALHPGTVASPLSDPFVSDNYSKRVLEPTESAQALLHVLGSLTPAQSGCFYDWRGEPIPW